MVENLFSRYERLLLWAGGGSLILFFLTLAAVPLVLERLPENFFILPSRIWKNRNLYHPVLFILWFLGKNLLGVLFLLMGLLMLFTPGQGLLTLFLGLLLISFPGKKHLVCWLLGREKIRSALNWFRHRKGLTSFLFPECRQ